MKFPIKKMFLGLIGVSAAAFCFTSCDDIPSEIHWKKAPEATRCETETPENKIVCPECAGEGCDICDHQGYTWE